jgi:hypothetical protein
VVAVGARGGLADNASGIRKRVTGDEGQVKPKGLRGYADLALYLASPAGKAWLTEARLDLEPYWGKPDVRCVGRALET